MGRIRGTNIQKDTMFSMSDISLKKKAGAGSDEDHNSTFPSGSQADDNDNDGDDGDDDDAQWQTNTSFKATSRRIQEQLSAMIAEMVMLSIDEAKHEKKLPPEVEKDYPSNGIVECKMSETFFQKASVNAIKEVDIALIVRY